MNWQLFFEGLAAAAINGFVVSAAQASTSGHINKGTAVAGGIGALVGVAQYLKQPATSNSSTSPAPPLQ